MVKGMKIQGYHEALECITKQEIQRCFHLWERHWVMCLNQEGDP